MVSSDLSQSAIDCRSSEELVCGLAALYPDVLSFGCLSVSDGLSAVADCGDATACGVVHLVGSGRNTGLFAGTVRPHRLD